MPIEKKKFAIEQNGTLRIFRKIKKGSKTRYKGNPKTGVRGTGKTTKNRTVSARCGELKKPDLLKVVRKHFNKRVNDEVNVVVHKKVGALTNKELCAYIKQRVSQNNNTNALNAVKNKLNTQIQSLQKYNKLRAGNRQGIRRRYNSLAKNNTYPTRRAGCKELSLVQLARVIGEKYKKGKPEHTRARLCERATDLSKRGVIKFPRYANKNARINRKAAKRAIKSAQRQRTNTNTNTSSSSSRMTNNSARRHVRFN
tara:strand:- start:599 stop:1363 length:765 start_codon:yes stop_codon:yes gene_type:complete